MEGSSELSRQRVEEISADHCGSTTGEFRQRFGVTFGADLSTVRRDHVAHGDRQAFIA